MKRLKAFLCIKITATEATCKLCLIIQIHIFYLIETFSLLATSIIFQTSFLTFDIRDNMVETMKLYGGDNQISLNEDDIE